MNNLEIECLDNRFRK